MRKKNGELLYEVRGGTLDDKVIDVGVGPSLDSLALASLEEGAEILWISGGKASLEVYDTETMMNVILDPGKYVAVVTEFTGTSAILIIDGQYIAIFSS